MKPCPTCRAGLHNRATTCECGWIDPGPPPDLPPPPPGKGILRSAIEGETRGLLNLWRNEAFVFGVILCGLVGLLIGAVVLLVREVSGA